MTIGVAVEPGDLGTVREFFELFKTPWEPAVQGRRYRGLLTTVGLPDGVEADLILAYGALESEVDRAAGVRLDRGAAFESFEHAGHTVPLYAGAAGFTGGGPPALVAAGRPLDYRVKVGGRRYWRVGYGLFDEVRHLLTEGQPASQALSPTLDRHIGVLKDLLLRSGIAFVEIPPRPQGHPFTCCLTHDIDFYGIRRHLWDRTLAGFLARASIGSLRDWLRGRPTASEALRNWAALASLPLVFLRVLPDFWDPIADYARADRGRPSTFFVVPFRGRAGTSPTGTRDGARAVKYEAADIATPLAAAVSRGSEVAVHGLDAWHDAAAGRDEMRQVVPIAGRQTAGVRMHWLYRSAESEAKIEEAGFDYDSTWGYSGAVGYRAGTSQAFRAPGTGSLLELPLSVMDTALFYPDRLDLSKDEGLALCRTIMAHAAGHGGTLVVNWHDRSLAPERLWGRAYAELLDELDAAAPWFATARDAVDWFRWRRTMTFSEDPGGRVTVQAGERRGGLPGALVAVCQAAGAPGDEQPIEPCGMVRVAL